VATVCVFPAFVCGALAVQLRRELQFSAAGVGLAVAAFFAAASLSSVWLGRTAERLGPGTSLRLSAAWSAAAQLAIAVAARSFATLLALLAVTGAANALAQPAANLLIARALPVSRQGLAFAVKQSAVPFATLLAGLAVPAIALTIGWRWAFVASAAVAGASAWLVPPVHRTAATAGSNGAEAEEPARDAPLATMLLLATGIALGAASAGTLGAFLVSAVVDAGVGEAQAGLLLSGGSAVGIGSRLVAGVRADRRAGGHLRVSAFMLLGGAVAYLVFAVGRPVTYLLATPLAFGAGWAWPGLFNLAIVRANPNAPGAATGITQTGTYAGVVAGPLLFGVVAERWSYGVAWLVAAVAALAAAAAMTAGRASLRRSRDVALPPVPA
jgi:predicted MFS family arabinose efflux permease